ncbi:cytochrome P450 (plasmid) [Nocardia sp. CA-084685]|uniref:cytochrome P450 n=1 Tax=Nocardia sp. CA-084685 TaxID=3239970 RepID=UPI003D999649
MSTTHSITPQPATIADYPPQSRLPFPLQTLLYSRVRHRWLTSLRARYGDVFAVRVPPYADRLVVVSRPEHVRQIFAADATDVHGGEGNHLIAGLMGERSVMVLDEEDHARMRRLLTPAFGGAALRGYRTLIEDITRTELERWSSGDTIAGLNRMNAMALEMIVQVVFGVTDPQRRAELGPRLEQVVGIHPLVLAGLHWPQLRNIGPWWRFHINEHAINELLYKELLERRIDNNVAQRSDVLSRMVAVGAGERADKPLSDREVRDQLITLLLAGHETTASALAWTLYELAANPHIQDLARTAVAEGDDKYLDAVFKESMRLHTVIGGTYRRVTREMSIGGYRIPAGVYVTTSSLLTHHDPENFPDALQFRPERFLEGEVAPHSWYAFGGGVRRCLGAAFAQLEGTVVLREVLTRYRLSLPPGARPERDLVRNITHVPSGGALVTVTSVSQEDRTC